MTEVSSIDALLTGGTVDYKQDAPKKIPEKKEIEEHEPSEAGESEESTDDDNLDIETESMAHEASDSEIGEESHEEQDEYGNRKQIDNEVIRDRLARQAESLKRQHESEIAALRQQLAQQNANPEVQKAAKDFEYDPDADGNWQQQLADFVKQTVNNMGREEAQARNQAREAQAQREFEGKFHEGMSKFPDFVEVVGQMPVTDAMTVATRAMKDPAAFLYAATKRAPQELERISRLTDPYSQMVEIGKLEERMRKNASPTKAPRPLTRDSDDSQPRATKSKAKEETIEDRLHEADKKRRDALNARRR
jgi:hypothetical protein